MAARTGLKTTFSWAGSTVAQVAAITPPGPKRGVVEVDELNPTNEIKAKLLGLIDAGEGSLTLNWDKAATGHTTMESAFWAGTSGACVITLPSAGGTCSFTAYVTSWTPSAISAGSVIQVEVGLTLVGKATWA